MPVAWITGRSLLERLAAWLFKVTGEAGAIEAILPSIRRSLQAVGYKVRHELVECPGSRVLVILATR
jgi:hypothetical protein